MTNSEEKYGKKIEYDPLWKGPMQNTRAPTDRIWLILFIAYVIIYFSAAMYALTVGDLNKATAPADHVGRLCGIDSGVEDKPYLLFLSLNDCIKDDLCDNSPSVCVSKCPTENFIYKRESNNSSLDKIKDKLICTTDVNIASISSFDHLDILISHKKCAKWYLKSEPVYDRCLAFNAWEGHEEETISSDELYSARNNIKEQEYFLKKICTDINDATGPSIVAIICGGIIALIYVVLLKWFAVPFFYASICMFCTFAIFGIYYLCDSYARTKEGGTLFALIILILFVVGVVVAVVYFRKKIYLACQLVKESSKAVMHLSSTLLFPILPWLLYVLVVVFSASAFLSLFTITTSNYRIERLDNGSMDGCKCEEITEVSLDEGEPCNPMHFNKICNANGQPCLLWQCTLNSTTNPSYLYIFHSINIVGFYWIILFISGFQYMVLGGAFGTWYWSFNKDHVRNHTLVDSTSRTMRYHMGTVAVGSLILTVSQIIRLILQGLQNRFREANHAVTGGFMFCCRSFFSVLDSLLNFLNYNAYIMCAIHGKSFCQSAKSAYNLIMRNLLKIIVVDTVAEWLFIMAKLLVTSMAVGGIMLYYNFDKPGDNGPLSAAIIITAIGTYIVASVFFSVQSVAVNTIFLCFIEDSERNDGSDIRPYYMSNKLKQLLHK